MPAALPTFDLAARDDPQRDVNGPLPVFKLERADCEEIGKGNAAISLCVSRPVHRLLFRRLATLQAKDDEISIVPPVLVSFSGRKPKSSAELTTRAERL